jgi:hypothetical protein
LGRELIIWTSTVTKGANMTEEENWRRAFEMIGPKTLRLRLETRRNEFSPDYARAAEIWLLEQDAAAERKETTRFNMIKRWTIAAAIAGIIAALGGAIAAWPVIRDLVTK